MSSPVDLRNTIFDAWKTNNRVTIFLVEHLPAELWEAKVPGAPRRTIRMIAGHMHNARCMWIKTLGQDHGIRVPRNVDRHRIESPALVAALNSSSKGVLNLLKLGCDQGGSIPATSAYVWRNLPLDVGHILGYFIAHEGHHRGQIVMLARQLGHRLPVEVTGGIWHWTQRAREV
ncbi:MAG TPA: DinB family protein [Pyrinomonadaceae bacterium]|nr:DinB family protein [Pyrinomonadaceae bacterium]